MLRHRYGRTWTTCSNAGLEVIVMKSIGAIFILGFGLGLFILAVMLFAAYPLMAGT